MRLVWVTTAEWLVVLANMAAGIWKNTNGLITTPNDHLFAVALQFPTLYFNDPTLSSGLRNNTMIFFQRSLKGQITF